MEKRGYEHHGMRRTKEYALWFNMKSRCNNPKHPNYKYYGGIGIKVCEEWSTSFQSFYEYIVNLEGYGNNEMSIDRIKSYGNYHPGNIRWANKTIQSRNRRLCAKSKSGYAGVIPSQTNDKWLSRIVVKKKQINLGTFNSIQEAAIARDKYIINQNLNGYPLQILE